MDNKRRIVGWTALCLALVVTLGSIAAWNHLSGMKAHAAWAEADRPHVLLLDEVALDNQALINYITGALGGEIGEEYANPYGEGRIVAVEAPAD